MAMTSRNAAHGPTARARKVARRKAGSARGDSRNAAAPGAGPSTSEQRHQLIAKAAYLRAERRGFAVGHELQDWLDAEAEVDALSRAAC